MPRINTNVMSLQAMHDMARTYSGVQQSLRRLSSGLRINKASDDPAGLIISETLRREISSTRQAIDNTERAANMLSTAEGGLQEMSTLLEDMRGLLVEGANSGALTDQEIGALQVQLDSSIASIDRIANSTTFGGRQLLNGSLGFTFSDTDPLNQAELKTVKIHQADLGPDESLTVEYGDYVPSTIGFATFGTDADAVEGLVVEITGPLGSYTYNFAPGTTAVQMFTTIEKNKEITGVGAFGPVVHSVIPGSEGFVRINVISGSGGAAEGTYRGVDGTLTVNGQTVTERGGVFEVNQANFKATIDDPGGGAWLDGDFTITGGGARFQVTDDVGSGGQVRLGIQSMTASNLGNETLGYLSDLATGGGHSLVGGADLDEAADIIQKAVEQVSTLRGRLGAVQRNTLETNVNSLQVGLENLSASESRIRDTDFAAETANLTRSQILVQAGTSVIATANMAHESVLALLG